MKQLLNQQIEITLVFAVVQRHNCARDGVNTSAARHCASTVHRSCASPLKPGSNNGAYRAKHVRVMRPCQEDGQWEVQGVGEGTRKGFSAMALVLKPAQRHDLEAAVPTERRTHTWKRSCAMLLGEEAARSSCGMAPGLRREQHFRPGGARVARK